MDIEDKDKGNFVFCDTKSIYPKQLKRTEADSTISYINDKIEIANEFNKHYTSIANKLVDKNHLYLFQNFLLLIIV